MELTVLGCYGPYPPAGGACSGYLLQQDGCSILIDCGNGVLSRLQEHLRIWELDAALLSHLHSDHVSDLHVMRYGLAYARSRGLAGEPLPLYAPPEPAADYSRLPYKDVFSITPLAAAAPLQIGPFRVDLIDTVHAVPCLAMRIQSAGGVLVYSGDTEYFPGLAGFAGGADLFLCEANFQEADMAQKPTNHLSASQAARLAAEAAAKKLLLTHLHPEREAAVSLKEAGVYFTAVEIAREGERYSITAG